MSLTVRKYKNKYYIHVKQDGQHIRSEALTKEQADKHKARIGGKLAVSSLKGLLDASYDGNDEVGNYEKDNELSSKTSKVYKDKNTGQVVVAHKGTSGLKDWMNNAVYAIGGVKAYKKTKRYKEAAKIQKKAEEKYGKQNISTIGHSQAGLQAELLGKNTKEIITLNKASHPFINRSKAANQHDIRTKNDAVSYFTKRNNGNEINIKSKSKNILKEHSIDTLNRLDNNKEIGQGIRKRRK